MSTLFGDEFEIKIKEPEIKDLIKKAKAVKKDIEVDPEKLLKSKNTSLMERLKIITENVNKVLGRQKNNIIVIKDEQTFDNYINEAIKSGRVAIDTETNNSTDPVTCKLMGPCFYYPGGKQAYVPINHRNPETKERLSWQLTEEDCRKRLQKITDSSIDIIMHNGKFDYEVFKCTCGLEVVPTWDTLVAARLIDENIFRDSFVRLKSIYTEYIDPSQEKYSIDHLFENIAYADVDPEVFALYAATDPMMTDKVYLWERETFYDLPENQPVLNLFKTIEMPIVQVTAEIELRGVFIDQELGERLKTKYNAQLTNLDIDINRTLIDIKPIIAAWRLTKDAIDQSRQYVSAKSKMAIEKIEASYPFVDEEGRRYKIGKSKSEQLPDEINLASPTQLAILLYDILECPIVDKKNPRATGEDEIKEIADKLKTNNSNDPKIEAAKQLCNSILQRRGLAKLITTYIDVIPDLAKHWPDGRIRYKLNSTGTDTGRFASGGKFKFLDENDNAVELNSINSQNLPSHNAEIRLLFKAADGYRIVGSDYSGQELRLAAFISQDKKLLDAYANNQDAYAIIASTIFNVPYEECLEFYKEFTELEIGGQKVIAGTDKNYEYTVENNCVRIPNCYLVKTDCGDREAMSLHIGEKLITDEGIVTIVGIKSSGSNSTDEVLLTLAKI